ncbi:MAG: thioredoxin [Planctomycetes bacterium]|nr:thioredoxin [Planctomycetota bacterium]
MATQSSWVFDTTSYSFQQDVLQRSRQVPVVVDFWAPWCSPCRQLGPILEKLAQEYAGRFLLAKVNIDENPDLAQVLGVQSIPLVVAFQNGQPVNQFVGVMPEESVREWLATFLPSPGQELVRKGESLERTDPKAAEAAYRDAIRQEPDNADAKIHLARLLLNQNREDESRAIIEELAARGYLEPEAEKIKSQLDLRASAEEAGDVAELRKAVEADPNNLELQIKLAEALAGAGRHQEALDICLRVIEQDKEGAGVEAKQTMLRIFDTLGAQSDLTSTYRRKLATVLY